jgi:uncharacterized protein YjiS (DUF1127 family)
MVKLKGTENRQTLGGDLSHHASIVRFKFAVRSYLNCSKLRTAGRSTTPYALARPSTLRKNKTMLTAIARYFRAWRRYDNAINELSHLTDRELADIGVSRCDIPRLAREHSIAEMAILPLRHTASTPYVTSPGLQHAPAKAVCLSAPARSHGV